jgi:glycosyltransferase involved in cell wall biosynthesis
LFHLIKLAVDGIFSFSIIPLRVFVYLGLIISAVSFIYGFYFFILKVYSVVSGNTDFIFPPGWATTVIVLLFLGGIQLMGIGVLGEYLGRVYDEVKSRPVYIVKESSIKLNKMV